MFEVSNPSLRGRAYDFQAFTVLRTPQDACLSPYFSVPDHSVLILLATTWNPALFRGLAAWVEDCHLEPDTRIPQAFCMQASKQALRPSTNSKNWHEWAPMTPLVSRRSTQIHERRSPISPFCRTLSRDRTGCANHAASHPKEMRRPTHPPGSVSRPACHKIHAEPARRRLTRCSKHSSTPPATMHNSTLLQYCMLYGLLWRVVRTYCRYVCAMGRGRQICANRSNGDGLISQRRVQHVEYSKKCLKCLK